MADPAAVRFDADGLLFSIEDEAYQLKVHGYLQANDRLFFSDRESEDSCPEGG